MAPTSSLCMEQHWGGSCTKVVEINAQHSACIVQGERRIHKIPTKWHNIDTKQTTNRLHFSICFAMFSLSSNMVHVSHNMILSKVPKVMQHSKFTFLPFIQDEFWSKVGCLAYKFVMFSKFLVFAWSTCGGLNNKHNTRV